jgi:4-hydroxy-tetrahydrodipicolinate synthase
MRGVLAPVVTPFKADLSPDPERLIAHCQRLLSQNCGLAVFGTNSEANSMAMEERMMLLDALLAAGVDAARMMPGTGCCSITEIVRLTAQAVRHGCAGVLMLPPFYYKEVGDEGLFRYFSEVIQRVGDARLRIYLYHIPPIAIVGITPKLVERLLDTYPETIAGMKDSSGDWNNTKTFGTFAKWFWCVCRQQVFSSPICAMGCWHHFSDGECESGCNSQIYAEWNNPETDPDDQRAKFRALCSPKSFPSMIAAMKRAIARVESQGGPEFGHRGELREQARTLAAELRGAESES